MESPPAVARRPWGLFIGAGVLVAAVAAGILWWRSSPARAAQASPVGYLLAVTGPTTVRFGWRQVPIETALTVPAGTTFELPAGARFLLIDATTGLAEALSGPVTRSFPASKRVDPKDEPKVDHLQGALATWLATLPAEIAPAGPHGLPIYTPAGVTRRTTPAVAWETRPNVRYDAAIRDPEDGRWPVRLATNTLPPVELSAFSGALPLRPDRIYELLVRETGAELTAGGAQFLVAADATNADLPTAPADCLVEAAAALAARPYRTGDAWTVLARLPPAWAQTALAVRLRLKCALELAAPTLFREARADAEKHLAR